MTKIEKFIKERNEALAKNDIKELVKFFKKNCDKKEYIAFKNSSNFVKKATLCKMICAVETFEGTELRKKSEEWLKEHHMKNTVHVHDYKDKIVIEDEASDNGK